MSETNFPGPEEIQRRLQYFMQSAFRQQGAVAEPVGESEAPAPVEDNVFDFHLTPRETKAYLDRAS